MDVFSGTKEDLEEFIDHYALFQTWRPSLLD